MLNLISDILFITILFALVTIGILAILIWIRNRTIKLSILRLFIQIVATTAIFAALLTWPLSFSPTLEGVTTLIAERLTAVLLLLFGLTAIFGRFFCGWLCPFAFYMDLLSRLRKAMKINYLKLPDKFNDTLDLLRYGIMGFILLSVPIFGYLNPNLWRFVIMFMGPFKPLIMIFLLPIESTITPIGQILGFNNWGASFNLLSATITWFNTSSIISLTWFVFIAFTAGSFIVRLLWCRFCPVGITFSILNRFQFLKWLPVLKINKMEEKCTKCGICKRVCPVQVNRVYDEKGGNVTSSKCLACFRCVEMCPYVNCLKITFTGKTIYASKNWLEPALES
jgi:ferredoxin-type protein NapH